MFGIANQLLAAIALAVGTVILLRMEKARYVWVTLVPLTFVTGTTLTAAAQMILFHYWPKTATRWVIQMNVFLIFVMVACSLVIFYSAFRKSVRRLPLLGAKTEDV